MSKEMDEVEIRSRIVNSIFKIQAAFSRQHDWGVILF
jgi:hypothetical protein